MRLEVLRPSNTQKECEPRTEICCTLRSENICEIRILYFLHQTSTVYCPALVMYTHIVTNFFLSVSTHVGAWGWLYHIQPLLVSCHTKVDFFFVDLSYIILAFLGNKQFPNQVNLAHAAPTSTTRDNGSLTGATPDCPKSPCRPLSRLQATSDSALCGVPLRV